MMSVQTAHPIEQTSFSVPFVAIPTVEGDVLTIAIVGELDMATSHLLEEAQRSWQGRYRYLRYELAGLGFLDSAGLQGLLAPASCGGPIGQISIANPSPIVRRLLEIRGVHGMIAA
jgi:anti-anti-sigma factor